MLLVNFDFEAFGGATIKMYNLSLQEKGQWNLTRKDREDILNHEQYEL